MSTIPVAAEGPPFFRDELGAIADGLREGADSHSRLNRAESRIDDLGRRLHGIGYVRAAEIAACITAALRELAASHTLGDEKRAEAVRRAAVQLDDAAEHAAAGVLAAEG